MFKSNTQLPPAKIIQQKLVEGHQIMPLPQVVGRLLSELKDPDVNASSLAKIVESDPALTVRLLRLANSPMYRTKHAIESVGRATTMLGHGPLKNIALTFAASKVFASGSGVSNKREQLWSHSLGCAAVARQLAKLVESTDPDEAFLAGMFHDVGKLFLYDVVPELYSELDQTHHGKVLVEKELELLGATHENVGVKLVTSWQLSEKLMIGVGFHHEPSQAIAHREMANLIHIADSAAKAGGIGSGSDINIFPSDDAIESLGLDEAKVEVAMNLALDEFDEIKQACYNEFS